MIGSHDVQRLIYTTTRVESTDKSGVCYTSTGFFYTIMLSDNRNIPVLVTTRYAVKDMKCIRARIAKVSAENNPMVGKYFNLNIDCMHSEVIYEHPNKNIDLAVIDLRSYLNELNRSKDRYFTEFLDKTERIKEADLKRIRATHEVLLVGYPNGLFDQVNRLPIFRKGIAATDPAVDYNGEKQFLIDVPCFSGTSGSPVFSYDNNALDLDTEGYATFYDEIKFMGVQSAVFLNSVNGRIHRNGNSYLNSEVVSVVIKVYCLDDFDQFFQ